MRLFLFIAVVIPFIASAASEYSRKDWNHWIDSDNDCQNTRHELLISESLSPVNYKNDKKCAVSTGRWYGSYLDKHFTESSDLDVDHIVPLKWAHDHGAAEWSKDRKKEFANDTGNLLLVDDSENQSKGAKGPAEWMPPNKAFHCAYLVKWALLIRQYALNPDSSDLSKIRVGLSGCGGAQVAEDSAKSAPQTSSSKAATAATRSKASKPSNITFHSYKDKNGVTRFSNIPRSCTKNGMLICANLDFIFSKVALILPTKKQTKSRGSKSSAKRASSGDAKTSKKRAEPRVKKSDAGKCHSQGSQYYGQTKNYDSFDSLDACQGS
jgi:hypothetical protein